jgi:hypothetical protein
MRLTATKVDPVDLAISYPAYREAGDKRDMRDSYLSH